MKRTAQAASSIRGILRRSYTAVICSLTIPLVITLLLLVVIVNTYNGAVDRIDCAAQAQNVLEQELPSEIWNIISGRKTFEQGEQYAMLDQLYGLMDDLTKTASDGQQKYLNAAVRALDTLEGYIKALGVQTAQGAAVSWNESLYQEITSVTLLAADMLDQYSAGEIELLSVLNRRINLLVMLLAAAAVLTVCGVVYASVRTYRQVENAIRKPILRMERMAARIAKGDMEVRLQAPTIAELYPLADDLNRMTEQLDRLIAEQIEQEKTLKKAELRALQAQITPHFVYNTLETIVWLAEEGKTREVVEVTMAFTDFLRISLSGGQDFISVAKEEQHVRSYLMIQSVRYGSIMRFEIDIDPALADKRMLKLMLQPLVENAIYHGIKNKRGRGLLRITGRQEQDWMVFAVADNGIGMTEEQLDALRARIERKEGEEGYGLRNITQRLRLYGGRGLEIESKLNCGTTVRFALPCAAGQERKEN